MLRTFLMSAVCLIAAVPPVAAVEQSEEFVAGLRGRGLSDVVLDYLDWADSSRLVDDQFKRQIPYHRAVTLIERARQTSGSTGRLKLLAEARSQLDDYTATNSDREEGAEARGQLAAALVEQAKRNVARSDRLPAGNADRDRYLQDARDLVEQARTMYERAEAFYTSELDKIPKTLDPKTDSALIEKGQLYRGRLAQARLLVAQCGYELAATHPPDSREFRRLNESAAAAFGELFEKYSQWLVGFYANLYEGRCYQALGEYKKALGCFDNIIAQPDHDPAFRRLIASAHRYQVECLLAEGQVDAAIAHGQAWLKKSRNAEQIEPEWLALRFRLADAYRTKAESLDQQNGRYRNLIRDARQEYRDVARHPGEFQVAARTAAAELGPDATTEGDPTTFAAAYDAGREALAALSQANIDLELARKTDADSVAEFKERVSAAQSAALRLFTRALSLAGPAADREQLNEVRYFCSWLNYQQENYYDAAVLGEFVSHRYPDHPAAAAAAKLAMASYERLYNLAVAAGQSKQQTEFAASRLAAMAEFITRRWPASEDAETALGVLLNFALRHDRLDDARRLLDEVSPDRRAQMELKLGNALWANYVELARQPAGEDGETTPEQIRSEAVALLERGIDAARKKNEITTTTAYSALYLTKAYLSDGKYRDAIDLLEDDVVGPLRLVESEHAAAAGAEFAASVYRTALQAYVSVTPPQAEKALAVMDELERSVEGDTQSADRLTQVYIGLGVELQRQIEELQAAGRDREAVRVGAAFTQFLDNIADRQQGANWAASSWIAQTYFRMGEGLGKNSDQATEYFARARDALQHMVDQAEADPSYAPNANTLLAAKKQLGLSQREAGDYAAALNTFSSILAEKVTRLDVQKAAAYTCQAWGEAGDPKWLGRAITGGLRQRSDGKNRIWGWAKIASVVTRYKDTNPRHRDTFFEAWLNSARCRYLMGIKSDGAQRDRYLEQANSTIRTMSQQYPDLGGDERKAQFDQLAREIQQAQGRTPRGLDEFADAAR